MIKCSEIIDKPIFYNDKNEYFSMVNDVILDKNSNKILGFTWKKKLIRKEYEIFLFDDLLLIGSNGLYVKKNIKAKLFDYNNEKHYILSYIHDILNKIILNPDGELIGIVRDMILDIDRGYCVGFEFSEGYIDDLISGRKLISAGFGYSIDSEALILYDSSIIQPQGRGLLNLNKFT
ncbi:PRC-barrel domain-containing protein [Lutispora thermophila]|uniref:Uncharacterized protein YrrD, contains PRC-barrel domain n=1 Tax=Lutispora thermophila DSM 19022 TaxID=1122184 RepID=A0A1M6F1T2_9FIRM|nr:PRC-barrel domain-containing protein [Lutispora thermophila]SHI91630.1 Uncharacterized protein YrrD, contains PRC-barrel domain [Lutispora thermophila DSM 19022]